MVTATTKETRPSSLVRDLEEGHAMGFLIRTTFWFSLVLLMLPFGGQSDADGEQVGPLRALMAAREAVGDIAGICERKPDVCETGKSALHTIGVRARASAKLAYEMFGDQPGEPDSSINTGTVAAAKVAISK
jgi:hypothetical protein